MSPPGLRGQERPERNRGHGERRIDRRPAKSVRAGFDRAVGEPAHRQDGGGLTDPVEGRHPPQGAFRTGQEKQGQGTYRNVDEEDRSPGEQGEHPAEHGTGAGGDRAADRPHRHGAGSAPGVAVGMADQRHRRRHHHGDRRPLHKASPHEHAETRSQTARRRSGHEYTQPGDVGAASAEAVRQRPGRQQQRGEHHGVSIDDPLQARDPATQIAADRWQGHVNHDGVEYDHEVP